MRDVDAGTSFRHLVLEARAISLRQGPGSSLHPQPGNLIAIVRKRKARFIERAFSMGGAVLLPG